MHDRGQCPWLGVRMGAGFRDGMCLVCIDWDDLSLYIPLGRNPWTVRTPSGGLHEYYTCALAQAARLPGTIPGAEIKRKRNEFVYLALDGHPGKDGNPYVMDAGFGIDRPGPLDLKALRKVLQDGRADKSTSPARSLTLTIKDSTGWIRNYPGVEDFPGRHNWHRSALLVVRIRGVSQRDALQAVFQRNQRYCGSVCLRRMPLLTLGTPYAKGKRNRGRSHVLCRVPGRGLSHPT